MTEELEHWEEEALAYLDKAVCGIFRPHAPTNLNQAGAAGGPVWSRDCRHGCGYQLSLAEFFEWRDANQTEWRKGLQ